MFDPVLGDGFPHPKHTPGPWGAIAVGQKASVRLFVGTQGSPASATGWAEFSVQPYFRIDEATANARLIAAAPDMLAALKLAESVCEDAVHDAQKLGDDDNLSAAREALAAVRAAIAKAEGRT